MNSDILSSIECPCFHLEVLKKNLLQYAVIPIIADDKWDMLKKQNAEIFI